MSGCLKSGPSNQHRSCAVGAVSQHTFYGLMQETSSVFGSSGFSVKMTKMPQVILLVDIWIT